MIGRRRRDAVALPERLDALRAATDLADGRLDPEAVAFARNVIDKADGRLRCCDRQDEEDENLSCTITEKM